MMKFSEIELPSNKKFGLFFTLVFVLTSAYLFYIEFKIISLCFATLACIFFILSFLKSELLLPFNKIWMRFGFLLGMIVSPIVLGLIFFLIFTPVGIFMRLFGRDELKLKLKKSESHWKIRDIKNLSAESFKHQF